MTGGGRRSSKKAAAALQGCLLEQSKEKLVVLLMEQAERDVRLWERLVMEKAAQGPGGFDAGPFLAAVEGVPAEIAHGRPYACRADNSACSGARRATACRWSAI